MSIYKSVTPGEAVMYVTAAYLFSSVVFLTLTTADLAVRCLEKGIWWKDGLNTYLLNTSSWRLELLTDHQKISLSLLPLLKGIRDVFLCLFILMGAKLRSTKICVAWLGFNVAVILVQFYQSFNEDIPGSETECFSIEFMLALVFQCGFMVVVMLFVVSMKKERELRLEDKTSYIQSYISTDLLVPPKIMC